MHKILVIDDNAIVRKTLVALFTEEGYLATSACDGHDGLRQFAKEKPDLVVTDIVLPNIDGIETIRTMLKDNPATKVIAMSGGARIHNADFLKIARRIGASETLAKPFDPDDLIQMAKRLLAA